MTLFLFANGRRDFPCARRFALFLQPPVQGAQVAQKGCRLLSLLNQVLTATDRQFALYARHDIRLAGIVGEKA